MRCHMTIQGFPKCAEEGDLEHFYLSAYLSGLSHLKTVSSQITAKCVFELQICYEAIHGHIC